MGRSKHYKSPAKVRRSYMRLISHLIKSQKKLALTDPNPKYLRSSPSKLKMTNVKLTNFPEGCPVCHLHQCELDLRHTIYFTVYKTLEESLAKKPPDEDPST